MVRHFESGEAAHAPTVNIDSVEQRQRWEEWMKSEQEKADVWSRRAASAKMLRKVMSSARPAGKNADGQYTSWGTWGVTS